MPALAFFEAGLLRSKNTLALLSQVLAGMVITSMMWILFGYSFVFGTDSNGFIGSFEHLLYHNVSNTECNSFARNIPAGAFAFFEMMFACISPLLITGAYAERVSSRTSLLFTILWTIFVYYPVAHWIWGHGFLDVISQKKKTILKFHIFFKKKGKRCTRFCRWNCNSYNCWCSIFSFCIISWKKR